MDTADLRSRLVAVEHNFSAALARLAIVEQWRAQMDILNARRDEQFENLKGRFDSLDKKIDIVGANFSADLAKVDATLSADMKEVNGTLSWLARLIIGTIITGGMLGAIGLLFKLTNP